MAKNKVKNYYLHYIYLQKKNGDTHHERHHFQKRIKKYLI